MFERYTESARRVLFFARYEAAQLGGATIMAEHLLLGLTREAKGVVCEVFALSHVSLKNIRQQIESRAPFGEKHGTSVEIPFSEDAKRVLQFAAEEADRLHHGYIGTEHLLLGLLREESSPASAMLGNQGLRLEDARAEIARLSEPSAGTWTPAREAEAFQRVDHIKGLVSQLGGARLDQADARQLMDRILFELEALKRRLGD